MAEELKKNQSNEIHSSLLDVLKETIVWFREFISTNYPKQPPFIRSTVFVFFIIVFTFTLEFVFNILDSGNYISGSIKLKHSDLNPKASFVIDVPNNLKYYTSDIGDFTALLPSRSYLTAKLFGLKANIKLINTSYPGVKKDSIDITCKIKMKSILPFINEFENVEIDIDKKQLNCEMSGYADFSLINSAFAGASSSKNVNNELFKGPNKRIIIKSIRAGKDWNGGQINASLIVVNSHKQTLPLLNSQANNYPVYKISLNPNRTQELGSNYYFSVPNNIDNELKFMVKRLGGVFDYFYKFEKEVNLAEFSYGEKKVIQVSDDIEITARYYGPYDLVYFKTNDEQNITTELLKSKLGFKGYQIISVPSLSGIKSNALFSNAAISYDVVQEILQATLAAGIELKTIQCSALKTSAKNQIQIGYSPKYASKEKLSEQKLNNILNTKSQKEFSAFCDQP